MSVTVTDSYLLSQLASAGHPVELTAPDGQSLGMLTRSPADAVSVGAFAPVSDPASLPVMTQARLDAILAAAKKVGEHPLFEDHLRAVEEYRRIHNTTEPDDN